MQQLASADSVVSNLGFEQAGDLQKILLALDCPRVHLIGIRLHNRHNETVGLLVFLLADSGHQSDLEKLRPDRIAFLQAVSGAAAVSIESQRLQARQKQLLDAFIKLLAGAIDAKSPYTGGHCQRVPALTLMLAQAAAASQDSAFSSYQPTEDEWEALHIAAWLHDCGKVTTPEYVVDKATKLETLNDRIHEIRTRFEVLKRDAWISYWQAVAQGGDEQHLTELRDATLAGLDDDFAFIARCNLGGEAMAEADLQRLRSIGQRTWTRTLDDRLGVSWEENRRQARTPAPTLPVSEPLLADKPEHLLERSEAELIAPDNPWGFKLDVPRYKYNRGELYNLSITRGTLTNEERYIINHHMVQTILMLSHLPFPEHLRNVPEIAGGHHEKMDGTGYPKRLKREDMSLPARMMAIADIFEALTAADRPYKKAKSLSEALGIMAFMCRDAHIDPQLFELFINAHIYLKYAERFLDPQQIDAVDAQGLLVKAGLRK
jgi:HD-GYP domain-containing protein (c-di-GMP phosphodiesterase class II)